MSIINDVDPESSGGMEVCREAHRERYGRPIISVESLRCTASTSAAPRNGLLMLVESSAPRALIDDFLVCSPPHLQQVRVTIYGWRKDSETRRSYRCCGGLFDLCQFEMLLGQHLPF